MDDQHVAVVTGGSRGIGKAVATTLAAQGFAVVVGFVARASDADQAVRTAWLKPVQARHLLDVQASLSRQRRSLSRQLADVVDPR